MPKYYHAKKGEDLLTCGASVDASCGGKQTGGKCRIKLISGFLPIGRTEEQKLTAEERRAGVRLACCHRRCEEDCVFAVVDEAETFQISGSRDVCFSAHGEKGYALAADLGTTTVVMELIDLEKGKILKEYTFTNPQKSFGADVITRVSWIQRTGVRELQRVLLDKMKDIVQSIPHPIKRMTVCGNPVMTHIFMGVDPAPLAMAPFACPVKEYTEISLDGFPFPVQVLPPISAYVGSDIVMGIYDVRQIQKDLSLLLDLGTNGEMVLCKDGRLYCTSAACGPAFEGGNMSCGQGAAAGAIDEFFYNDGIWNYHTIQEKEATGICGSGYMSLLALAVKHGFIDAGGYMEKELIFHPRAKLSQRDVREFQLAKSAIAAALVCLCRFRETAFEEIRVLYLAGGFGAGVKLQNLFDLGILPVYLRDKVKVIGNSAVHGCVSYAINQDRDVLETIIGRSQSLLLANNRIFSEQFMANMMFVQNDGK